MVAGELGPERDDLLASLALIQGLRSKGLPGKRASIAVVTDLKAQKDMTQSILRMIPCSSVSSSVDQGPN